jgi:uncharacterized protein YlaI
MLDSKEYEDCLCDDCKKNIIEQTQKLSLLDKLRPQRVAKKSTQWICTDCKERITKKLLRKGRR